METLLGGRPDASREEVGNVGGAYTRDEEAVGGGESPRRWKGGKGGGSNDDELGEGQAGAEDFVDGAVQDPAESRALGVVAGVDVRGVDEQATFLSREHRPLGEACLADVAREEVGDDAVDPGEGTATGG